MTTTFNNKMKIKGDTESMFQRMLDNHIARYGYNFSNSDSSGFVRFAKKKGIDFDDHYSRSDMMGVSEKFIN